MSKVERAAEAATTQALLWESRQSVADQLAEGFRLMAPPRLNVYGQRMAASWCRATWHENAYVVDVLVTPIPGMQPVDPATEDRGLFLHARLDEQEVVRFSAHSDLWLHYVRKCWVDLCKEVGLSTDIPDCLRSSPPFAPGSTRVEERTTESRLRRMNEVAALNIQRDDFWRRQQQKHEQKLLLEEVEAIEAIRQAWSPSARSS